MRIAVTGGTGFIGSHLIRESLRQGDDVVIISRKCDKVSRLFPDSQIRCVTWGELEKIVDSLENVDAIVNLAGESINQRWTEKAKRRILESRLAATRRTADIVERLKHKPRVMINGSGVAVYGVSETDTFDETSKGSVPDFLSGVVERWEKAAKQISGTRLITLRTGIVLGKDGGALPPMIMPYRLWIGGRVGNGKQALSWIHVEDMVRVIRFCIENEFVEGPVNAVAPNPVTYEEFGKGASQVLRRPYWLPVPDFMLKLIFGEMSTLLLKGQRVVPRKLLLSGFEFRHQYIHEALKNLF
jgi:uncharacterized protein (TIGR01777 family)